MLPIIISNAYNKLCGVIIMNGDKRKRALGYSFATMLILVGVLLLILIGSLSKYELLGIVAFFLCLIPSVGIYVYLGCTAEPTDVNKIKRSKKSDAISSAIWLLATSAFFIIGFIFDRWSYAWIVFLVAAAIQSLAELFNKEDID